MIGNRDNAERQSIVFLLSLLMLGLVEPSNKRNTDDRDGGLVHMDG
jgi:hypothetical protein